MSPSITWVSPRHVDFKTNVQGDYYAFVAIDRNFKRYRIFSDASLKVRLIHFLAAIEAGAEIWMPIEPKNKPGFWQVALDYVDDEPPAHQAETGKKAIQLSFEPPRRTFSCMVGTKKQSFVITEDYSRKADNLSRKLNFPTKSDFLANVVANYLDLSERMDAIC